MESHMENLSPVVAYVTEEVRRQGHDVRAHDGISRVGYMLNAWAFALEHSSREPEIMLYVVEHMGRLIEPQHNAKGVRNCAVFVGGRACPPHERVISLLFALFEQQKTLTPMEFYKEFQLIHPFRDGNGRTGKILLNWLNGTLLAPIFPPADLFGRAIQNP